MMVNEKRLCLNGKSDRQQSVKFIKDKNYLKHKNIQRRWANILSELKT